MKLAQRMSRIASESAFEVLVRARALEAAGRDVVEFVEERDGVAWWKKGALRGSGGHGILDSSDK